MITGASRGLGAALAAVYAGEGVALTLIARNPTKLAEVAHSCRACGAAVETAIFDVGGDSMATWLEDLDRRKPVDLVIANAGISEGVVDGKSPEGLRQSLCSPA